jgi:hypothetical protein
MYAVDTAHHTSPTRGIRPTGRTPRQGRDPRARKGSLLTGFGLFVLVAFSLIAAGALPTLADAVPVPTATRLVAVDATDTLWSIARANGVAGIPTADMVRAITRLNDLGPGQGLQPGAVVRVPVEAEDAGAVALR